MSTVSDEAVFVQELDKRLRRLEQEFEEVVRKAETAEVSVRSRVQEKREDFQRRREELINRMNSLRSATGAAIGEMRSGVEAAWNDLSDSFNDARAELMRGR